MIKVASGLINYNGKYLIGKRATGNPEVLGKWEFPGGTKEEGETFEECLIREIKEEYDIDIVCDEIIARTLYKYASKEIDICLIKAKTLDITNLKINYEHTDYKWINFDEFKSFDLAPADKILLEMIEGENI